MDKGSQRMGSTIGVPQRESGIVGEIGMLIYLTVSTPIVAIHVVEHRRSYHGVVQRGIEDGACHIVMRLNLYLAQLLLPLGVGLHPHLIEVPVGVFCL